MSTPALARYEHYIDGASVSPAFGQYLPTDGPYTGQSWGETARGDTDRNIKDIYSPGKKASHASTD